MQTARIGLLGLYLELYDRLLPGVRERVDAFYEQIARSFEAQGVTVEKAPVCRIRPEFAAAIRGFEKTGVDAVVTLHLAYSPSLESASLLAETKLPVIILDTSPTFAFGPDQCPDEIMYNHGIHGVQDLCNLLVRHGKPFCIEAGHWQKSDVIKRVVRRLPAARMARVLRTARVGLIGKPFAGMGDFSVSESVLKSVIGARVVKSKPARMRQLVAGVSPDDIAKEVNSDCRRFAVPKLSRTSHELSVMTGLAVRRWISEERLTALSMNFEHAGKAAGLPVMPFLEFSKAMARGVGYAGEGDVLTAALVGALASVVRATTFAEMFCADWKGNRVFMSHMGEFNVDLAEDAPLLAVPGVNFTPAALPVIPYGCLRKGPACLVCLAPIHNDRFRLIIAPVTMEVARGKDRFENSVRGWFRPAGKVDGFLAAYSRLGGIHHAALVYDTAPAMLQDFAYLAGLEAVTLDANSLKT